MGIFWDMNLRNEPILRELLKTHTLPISVSIDKDHASLFEGTADIRNRAWVGSRMRRSKSINVRGPTSDA